MNGFVAPFIVSMLISVSVYIYTWRRREVAGAAAFSWFVLLEIIYIFAHTLELIGTNLEGKLFWGKLQFVITILGPLALLYFAITFTRWKLNHPQRIWTLLLSVSLFFLVLLYTNNYYHLVFPEGSIAMGEPSATLEYKFAPVGWIFIIYSYCVGLWGVSLLISSLIGARKLFRHQILIVVFGVLMIFASIAIPLPGIISFSQLDPTYIASSIGGIIIAIGLFRYRLFDIIPIARDMLIEKMHAAVFVLDTQNRLIDINPAAIAYLKKTELEVMGRSAEDVIPEWNTLVQKLSVSQNGSLEIAVGEGIERLDFSMKRSELLDEKGNLIGQLVVVRDIKEQKRVESELRSKNQKLGLLKVELEETNQHLRKLSQAKNEFLDNVTHELRTLITNIKLQHELVALQPERAKEFLEILSRETDRVAVLAENVLTLSRFDQEIIPTKPGSFDLETLIKEYVIDRKALAESRGISLSISDGPNGSVVYADRDLIGQVVSNLLTNALNYTPEDGDVIISILEPDDRSQKWFGFSVKDSGVGISPEDQEQLFFRYFRGSAGHKSGISGMGLGLAIVKEIVDRNGGTITVESNGILGEGTTFTVWLPIDDQMV